MQGFRCTGDLEGCRRVAIVAVGAGSGTYEATVTAMARIREEYRVDCVLLVHTDRGVEVASRIRRDNPTRDVKLIQCAHVSGAAGELERDLRRLVETLCDRVEEGGLVLSPTPGSRRLAAAIGMAGVGYGGGGEACNTDIVHVDFYWDAWTGLPYPLVPRWLEPLQILNPVYGPPAEPVAAAIDDAWARKVASELPPLRRAVALLSFNLNSIAYRVVSSMERCNISLEVRGLEVTVDDVCSPDSWGDAANELYDRVSELFGDETAMLAGLKLLVYRDNGDSKPLAEATSPIVIDTNLVYRGIHVEAYAGLNVVIPYCAYAEVMKAYAEALKNAERDPKAFARLLAGLALQELRRAGTRIAPSPPPPCDTSIPSMDPLVLSKTVMATADQGAYQLWKSHPISLIAKPVYVEPKDIHAALVREKLMARASYALLQTIAVLCLADHCLQLRIGGQGRSKTITVSREKLMLNALSLT